MNVNNINCDVIKKKYHVSEYKITYKDENSTLHEIYVPNKLREVHDGHEIRKIAIEYISINTPTKDPKIKKIDKYGDCAFCEKHKKLERSHVIGNSVFSQILKKSENGNAVRITPSSPKKIKRDNHSWAIEMLCSECETMFNIKFENYAINALRGKITEVKVSEMFNGISFNNLDQYRMILYVLSIYWRGAYSIDKAYNNLIMNYAMSSYLKECFEGKQELLKKAFSIRISRLYDESGSIDSDGIKDLIINPFVEKQPGKVSYSIVFEGFLFEIYLLAQPFKERQKRGYLNPSKNILFVPFKYLFSIEGVVRTFQEAIIYHHETMGENIKSK